MQCAGAGGRWHLRDDLVAVADVDVLLGGGLVERLARGVVGHPQAHQVVLRGQRLPGAVARRGGRVGAVDGAGAGVREAVVAVHGGPEVGGRGALVGRVGAELDALQEAGDALAVGALVGGEHVLVAGVGERVAVDVARHAAGRPAPLLREVAVQQPAGGVGPVLGQLVAARRVTGGGRVGAAGHQRVQVHRHVRDARLPVLGGGVPGVELVAGRVVADRADDAAVARVDAVGSGRVVGVDAPVEPAAETDDVQHADVDAGALDGGRGRLVVSLVGDAGGVEGVVVGLHDRPLAERVGGLEPVVPGRVGGDGGRPAVHQRVVLLAHGQGEVGDARLGEVLDPVAVGVVEDVALVLGPPAVERQVAQLLGLAVADRHVDHVQVVVLRLVPPAQGVVAVRHARDVEGAVGVALAHPDRLVAVLQVGQGQPGLDDRLVQLGAGVAAPVVEGAAARRRVGLDPDHHARDVPAAAGEVVPRRREAEQRLRDRLAGPDGLGVEAGAALHHPGVPVVVALERGGLGPPLAVRWGRGQRVAVGAQVRDGQQAGAVADAGAALDVDHRQHVRIQAAQRDDVRVRVLPLVRRTQRVAVHVGAHLTERVVDVPDEARQAVVPGVERAVGGGDVGEHLAAHRGVGQRVGLQPDGHQAGARCRAVQRHGEVRAVELEAVGQHRDQVATARQGHSAGEVRLGALGVDGARVRHLGDRRPAAGAGVARRVRRAPSGGGPLLGGAGVVLVDDELVVGDRIALAHPGAGVEARLGAGADHLQAQLVGGRGGGRHGQREEGPGGQPERGEDGQQPSGPTVARSG